MATVRSAAEPAGKITKRNIQRRIPHAVLPPVTELESYWRKVSKRALPYIRNRPLTLVRSAGHIAFFHERELPALGPGVHGLTIEKREGGAGLRVYVDSLQGLLGLTRMAVVELHVWNATVPDFEHADQMVFDLDPAEEIEWDFVTASALALRDMLERAGLRSWPKATGGKGLHVVVPLKERPTHDKARELAKTIAAHFAAADAKRYTAASALAQRHGKLFIDYLRNGRGATSVAPYSPRARANFPIAVPLDWDEVERGVPSDGYTMHRLPG